jgi:hypothetical protein
MQALDLQPLKLTISGAYYDSQIYDSRLFLWKADGSILVLDWDKLVDSVTIEENLKTVFTLTFKYGKKLYENLLIKDTEIKNLVMEKLQKLSSLAIDISERDLTNHVVSLQDNPFPFPHADSSIHYKTLYVGSQSGVSRSRCSYSRKIALNPQTEKLWDAPVLSLTASNNTLAIAAGSEGLFDYSIGDSFYQNSNEPRNITEEHSNFARWMYPGIFSSSYFNDGYFADFQEIKEPRSKSKELRSSGKHIQLSLFPHLPEKSSLISLPENSSVPKPSRELKQLFSYHEIFTEEARTKQPIFTWGARDKIYLVTEDSIELVRCFPREKKETEKFKSLGSTEVEDLTGDIVSADSSFFGIVLEEEDSLLVINSLLQHKRFSGEPVNWRVFPDSVNYVNQLHIIYEDSIQIYFFTHDYFLNQKDKIIGISFGTE